MRPSKPWRTCSRREAAPDDVGEVRRDVIERLRPNQRLVRRRQQREARAQAGAEDADPFVALPRQPLDRAPGVEDRLATHLHRPHDVRADDVVGALELGRHPLIVVRQRESQRAQAAPREDPAQADMTAGVRVPLRQHEHSGRPPPARRRRKYRQCTMLFSGCGVVKALGNVNSRPPSSGPPSRYSSVGGGVKNASVSPITPATHSPMISASPAGVRTAIVRNPVEAPFKRADDAIGGDRRQAPLPRVKHRLQHRPVNNAILPRRCCSSPTRESETAKSGSTHVGGVVLER